jgi:DNA-binding transcriptional MerR regulator
MSINYLRDIKPLQDQGLSNAEIARHLSDRTARPMNGADSQYLLKDKGAVLQSAVFINERTGTLIEYYKTMPEGNDKNLVGWFIAEVFSGNNVRTDEYPRSVQYAMVQLILPSELAQVAQDLVNLAGGRPDVGTTEQNVVDIQAAYDSEQQIDQQLSALDQQYWSLNNQHIAPLQQSRNVNSADWKNAIQSMADGWVE